MFCRCGVEIVRGRLASTGQSRAAPRIVRDQRSQGHTRADHQSPVRTRQFEAAQLRNSRETDDVSRGLLPPLHVRVEIGAARHVEASAPMLGLEPDRLRDGRWREIREAREAHHERHRRDAEQRLSRTSGCRPRSPARVVVPCRPRPPSAGVRT